MTDKDKIEPKQLRSDALAAKSDIADSPEVEKARHSSAAEIGKVEENRTNRSSGSAGGDQHASMEIIFSKEESSSRLNPTKEADFSSGKPSESMQDLIIKARQGDENAEALIQQAREEPLESRSLTEDIQRGAAQGDNKSDQFNTNDLIAVQKDASMPAEQRMVAKQVQDMRMQAKLLGQPTDVLDDYVKSEILLKGGIAQVALEKPLSTAEETEKLAAFRTASSVLLEGAASNGDDPAKIARLGLAPDDVGSSLGVYLLGADWASKMAPEDLKNFGDRVLIFGLAPMFGAAETGHQKWQNSKAELGVQGSINFFIGTAIGAALEKANPVVFAGVFCAGLSALGYSQVGTKEAQKRNEVIAQTYANVDNLSPLEVLAASQAMSKTIGPEIFEGGFGLATGGVGLPEGSVLRTAADNWLAKIGKLPGFKACLEELKKDSTSTAQGIKQALNGGWRYATEGPLSEYTLAMGKPKPDRQEFPDWHAEIRSRPKIDKVEIERLIEHPKVQDLLLLVKETNRIPEELGKEIADMIALSIKDNCPRVNKKNIGFAILQNERGEFSILKSVSSELNIDGTCSMVDSPKLPITRTRTVSPRSHAEMKILENIVESNFKGRVWIFSEQIPCGSCGPAIEFVNSGHFEIKIEKPTWLYKNDELRQKANFMRGESLDD